MEKTKYRLISDGHFEYLQYLKITKVLFWNFKRWRCIPKPYCDLVSGTTFSFSGYYTLVTGDNIAKNFPNIEDYWPVYKKEQQELVDKHKEYWKTINERKNTVTEIN